MIDAANTSSSAATLFPNGLTLGTGGSCALSYNGGGCFYAPNTGSVNLQFSGSNALEIKAMGGLLIDDNGSYSALTLNRLDTTLGTASPVGKILFQGNNYGGTSQTWGNLTCDVNLTNSSGTGQDSAICRLFANSAGVSTEYLDLIGATLIWQIHRRTALRRTAHRRITPIT